MPYTIPSSVISPGAVYQPKGGLPSIIKTDGRAAYFTRGGSIASGRVLDQLPSNNGTRRTGEGGRCVDLNGTNQAVRVADNTALDITDNLTVMAWVKNTNATTAGEFILTKYDTGANKREWALGYNSSQKLFSNIGSSDGSAFTSQTSDAAVSIDSWNHVAFTFSAGSVALYVNGSLVASTASATHPISLNNEDADLIVGAGLSSNAITNPWNGQIFDDRIYLGDSTVLTAEQIAAIYADGPNNIQFDGQTLAAHYKLDEQSGTTCYDSSGNANNGTIENAVSNWSVTHDILSFQNQVGYNKRMYFDGVDDYVNFNSFDVDTSGGFEVNLKVYIADPSVSTNTIFHNYSDTIKDISIQASGGALRSTLRSSAGTFSKSWDSLTSGFHVIKINFDGSNLSLFVNGVEYNGTNAVSLASPTGDQGLVLGRRITGTGTGDRYFQGIISNLAIDVGNTGALNNLYQGYGNTDADWIDQIGSNNGTVNGSPSNIFLPRDESDPTNDVFANPLTNTGRRPNDAALHSSNCLTADGTLYIAAAHLTGSETVVSSGGTSTPSISAGRIDFTAGTCWDLTLSDGTHYPLSEGWGVDIGSSTSDNDGVLTNSILANAWGATQDEYHYNLLNGFSLYEHASTADIRWPFKNGAVKTLTPPTGYSKTSDNPAGNYHNNAETLIDLDPDSTPEMGATQLGITVPASHAFGDAFAASTQIFSRQRTLTEDRLVVMPEAQTGSALATIQRYTQP